MTDKVVEEQRDLSMAALESTLQKLSRAYASMEKKGAMLTLVAKRLDAVRIGMASLRNTWYGETFEYTYGSIASAKTMLQQIIPSIETQLVKAKKSSAQHTLIERRLEALGFAIALLEQRM
jgi:phage shock protein A